MKFGRPISQFAIVGNVVMLRHSRTAYIFGFQDQYVLVRARSLDGEWGPPEWIEAFDDPIFGTPTLEIQAKYTAEARSLPPLETPPLPAKTNSGDPGRAIKVSSNQWDLFA